MIHLRPCDRCDHGECADCDYHNYEEGGISDGDDLMADAEALASAGFGTDEDYGGDASEML